MPRASPSNSKYQQISLWFSFRLKVFSNSNKRYKAKHALVNRDIMPLPDAACHDIDPLSDTAHGNTIPLPNKMPLPLAQRLDYDVLSTIFVMSSQGSRRDTLELSSVCRQWRYIALSVPEIWSKFRLGASFTPYILSIFLERSKPLPLHIFISNDSSDEQLGMLSSAADRIACMTIFNSFRFLQIQFPILERLVFVMSPEADYRRDVESFSKALQFSQLREFGFAGASFPSLDRILDMSGGFPGLQKLEVLCMDDSCWDSVVRNTSNTLISLSLHVYSTSSAHDLSFPQLRHLQIKNRGGKAQLLLDLDAPQLESVEQGHLVGKEYGIDIQLRNPSSVEQLFITFQPLDLTLYPALRKLWIYDLADYIHVHEILASLRGQITLCPEIEAVFYCGQSRWEKTNDEEDEYSRPESVLSAIAEVVQETGRDVKVRGFCLSELDLPGSIQGNVGIPLIVILLHCHD
jgi:F-box-like